ncbi:MAG TPA: nitrate reductase, partial [Marinobacter adhaerens]|nr:nitrate reductase [Marinobacter adhaerens]
GALARALGHRAGFDYGKPADIFREHARLSGFENAGQRFFDISGLAELSNEQYELLEPVQWPVTGAASDSRRLFTDGRFATANGRARLMPVASRLPARNPNEAFPLIVNTGRIRDQWHTMTRTARSSRLLAHRPEPFIEVHPEDIRALSLTPGALATLKSAHGHFVGRVRSAPEQRRGEVFVPIHWNDQFTGQGLA